MTPSPISLLIRSAARSRGVKTVSGLRRLLANEGNLLISRQGVSKWWNGQARVSVQHVPVVAQVLGLDVNAVLTAEVS